MAEDVNDIVLDGGLDSAALAIQNLLNPPKEEPAPQPENPAQDAPEQPQQADDQAADTNTDEAAAPAETPADQPQGDITPAIAQAPPPAPVAAPQVATQGQNDPQTAQIQTQLNQVNSLVPILQGQLQAAFPDINSPDDLIRVSQTDPARAIAYQAAREKVQTAINAQAQLQANYRSAWMASESAKLQKLIPDIADPQKGPALQAKLTAYARECGYTDQQIQWAAASDVALLHQAMLFRDSQSARAAQDAANAKAIAEAKAKAAKAPPVQQPGTQRQTNGKEEKAKEGFERLQKTGHINDAAAVFRNILG